MSEILRFVQGDWARTRERLARAWSDRAQPCFSCGIDLRSWRSESNCPNCRKSIRWSAGFIRDGRWNLFALMVLAATPALVLWFGLKLQDIWIAQRHDVLLLGGAVDPTPLLVMDAASFIAQMAIFGAAMIFSLHRTRLGRHAIMRLGVICAIGAAYWTIAPHAHQWL